MHPVSDIGRSRPRTKGGRGGKAPEIVQGQGVPIFT